MAGRRKKDPIGTATATLGAKPKPARTPAAIVREQMPPCVGCGATSLRVLKKIADLPQHGIGPDGKRYTSVVRRRVRCDGCGQCQVLVSRPYDPKVWRA